ncbi:MAG TPA: carbohydrate ABC transporter permease [Candidatus Hydrogenedentes bacterium]|nr:carbohydrate ABC transporter permease [Candidatus Hydrogenedentota bacterium]HOL77782.1 carbohydrate ABC transporter permease [Candidatus Hydrogenedentota bacterium]HPO86404.1 carbohydrate ABC transporter permease [Candidatus Hydrogenedentota bacterium]
MSITNPNQEQFNFRGWWFRKGRFLLSHLFLGFLALTMLLPFLWMLNASIKPLDAIEQLSPLPERPQKARFVEQMEIGKKDTLFPLRSWEKKLQYYTNLLGPEQVQQLWEKFVREHPKIGLPPQGDPNVELQRVSANLRNTFLEYLAETQFSLARYYSHYARTNYHNVWNSKDISFKRYYFNSLFVAAWVTLLQCFTSAMAAYAFSRLHWPGRDSVFKLYLATMMIPGVVTMIPNFALMVKLRLLDSYVGLIVPAAFSAFGTFLLRQFMLTIPPSLDEAAIIDGASQWQIFSDIILPLSRPGLIVLSIFTFMGNYGSFFWPLVLIKSEHLRTLPIGMLYFDSNYGNQTNLIMAASVMNIVPLIILFVAVQKHLVRGIQLGAIKG